MKKLVTIFTITAGLLLSAAVFNVSTATAQEEETSSATQNTENSSQQVSYEFVARRGDSQSILVRRAIQLYTGANDLDITRAAAMYCETNVVQDLGSQWLEVGERVSVPVDKLQTYIDKSNDLSDQESANWQYWADQASFNLDNLQPVNIEEVHEAVEVEREKQAEEAEEQPQEQDKKEESDSGEAVEDEEDTLSWLFWGGLVAITAGGSYWIRKRNTL